LLLLAGCKQGQVLRIHYAGHPAKMFFPAKIAVVSPVVARDPDIGTVFDRGGYVRTRLYLPDAASQIGEVITRSLADAGLQPVLMSEEPANDDLPAGIDFMITSTVEDMRCMQRFMPEAQGSILSAHAQMHFTLSGRGGELYSADESGDASAPSRDTPTNRGSVKIVEPDDAVSTAVTRTIIRLLDDPQFEEALPHRTS
jgi:hypothetical protein